MKASASPKATQNIKQQPKKIIIKSTCYRHTLACYFLKKKIRNKSSIMLSEKMIKRKSKESVQDEGI